MKQLLILIGIVLLYGCENVEGDRYAALEGHWVTDNPFVADTLQYKYPEHLYLWTWESTFVFSVSGDKSYGYWDLESDTSLSISSPRRLFKYETPNDDVLILNDTVLYTLLEKY